MNVLASRVSEPQETGPIAGLYSASADFQLGDSSVGRGERVTIVGAGLVGCLMACYLRRLGFDVTLYERRSDPRAKGYAGGRSINLALSVRGLRGLAGVGMAEQVMAEDALPMPGRIVHALGGGGGVGGGGGGTIFQPYSSNPQDAINSVSRGGLNITLINAAERAGARFVFERACIDIDLDAGTCIFEQAAGAREHVSSELVLGCDGAFSPVRLRMQRSDRFEFSQSYLGHGYKELHIPPLAGEFAMDPKGLHIWPRGGAMMIALPNRDRSFTCTLFWPFEGEHGFEALKTDAQTRAFFGSQYPDAVPLMPTLLDDFRRNPTSSLVTVRCWPWVWKDRVCMLGDAAHAIVPFYGQGMNSGFEDCLALAECLSAWPGDRAKALDEFQHRRKPNADAIADMAIENFVEMRDKVGVPAFRERKRVEQALHKAFPDRCKPQYNLVSFSTVPYVEAKSRGRALDAVVDRVVQELQASGVSHEAESVWVERVTEFGRRALAQVEGAKPDTVLADRLRVIDISPALTPDINVWPGDTPLTREIVVELSKGQPVTLSTMRSTVHLGSHADGPNHYVETVDGRPAPGVGEWEIERFLGPCHVVWAAAAKGTRVLPRDLRAGSLSGEAVLEQIWHSRVLVRTGTFTDHRTWNSDFSAFSVELIDALAAHGVRTVGLDSPSVDLQDSKDLPAHKAIARHGIAILEGLVLADVPAGEYELVALPLKLIGFDASPVRAVLRPIVT
jgi:kynurenine 3-monooxygenase